MLDSLGQTANAYNIVQRAVDLLSRSPFGRGRTHTEELGLGLGAEDEDEVECEEKGGYYPLLLELKTQLFVFCRALYGGFLPPTSAFLDWLCHTYDERVNICLHCISKSVPVSVSVQPSPPDQPVRHEVEKSTIMLVDFVKHIVPLLALAEGEGIITNTNTNTTSTTAITTFSRKGLLSRLYALVSNSENDSDCSNNNDRNIGHTDASAVAPYYAELLYSCTRSATAAENASEAPEGIIGATTSTSTRLSISATSRECLIVRE